MEMIMVCESPILVTKPLVFLHNATNPQIKAISGCQGEEVKDGIVLV